VAQDTIVGVLGAVLIVGSMVTAINVQDTTAPGEGEVQDAPPAIGTSTWKASSCEAGSVYWTPALEDLDEVVGPNLEPAEGPLPDRGLFWLFVFDCDRSSVNGLTISPPTGASALVAVEEPDDTRNVTAPDGWAAIPSQYGSADSQIADIFDKHGFNYTPAQAAVGTSSTPLSDDVRLTLDTPTGYFEASLTLTGPTNERTVEGAIVGTSEDRFSVFSGEERMDRRENGTSTIETRGTTWVERLNLDPNPYAISYDKGMAWNFTFEDEPFDGNASEPSGNGLDTSRTIDDVARDRPTDGWALDVLR